MKQITSKRWWAAAGIRALKTVAQTAVALIGTCTVMQDVNWIMVGSASVLSGILSLLTSIAGLPELENVSLTPINLPELDISTDEEEKGDNNA